MRKQLIERLRGFKDTPRTADNLCYEAADRIEELERERNEAASAVQRLSSGQPFEAVVIADVVKRRTAAIERERDALQADNARLREALTKSIEFVPAGYGIERECWSAIHDTPEQSLARIRNQVRDADIKLATINRADLTADAIRASKEPE